MDLEQAWSEWVWSKTKGFHDEEEFPDAETLLKERKEAVCQNAPSAKNL